MACQVDRPEWTALIPQVPVERIARYFLQDFANTQSGAKSTKDFTKEQKADDKSSRRAEVLASLPAHSRAKLWLR